MPIRHHNNIGEILPPFYENLVFWAPLTEGDLTDHISGISPTTDSGCSVTWDAVKGMYRLYAYNRLMSSLKYDCLHGVMMEDADATVVIYVEEIVNQNIYNMILGFPPYENSSGLIYLRHDRFNSSLTNKLIGTLCAVYDNHILKFYINGNLINTLDWTGAILKTNIGGVRINEIPNNYNYSGTIYAKNARIYNRALTASEVAQL